MHSSKLKTLYIYKLLEKYSDEEHPLSTTQLISMLQKQGITCERKSIYTDINALNEIGCDIIATSSPSRGYFMANRVFELPEVMLLVDAVSSAGFITPKKTDSLIIKLKSLVSDMQAKSLESQVYVDAPGTKCDNEEIYLIIDQLHNAIMNKKKVKFVYRKRNIDMQNKRGFTEKTHRVSPYALIWKNDHYYLVCNNEKYDNLLNLRIDRMKKLTVLDDEVRPFCEVSEYTDKFDTQDYSSKLFNMFSGESQPVTLECDLKIQEEMMDRFGAKIPLKAADNNKFITTVDAALSDGLVSWIMQYGELIKVIEPQELVDKIKNKAEKIIANY